MSLALLIPAALAALAALLVPLLIHLARRSEQRPTAFAALRWLRQKPRPRHRIRFDEWPLLIVRLLLVALMALLLARPVLHGGENDAPYVAVAPGVALAQARTAVPAVADARWHWLEPDFPSIETVPDASSASISSLLRELDAELPAGVALTVVVPDVLQGVDGGRVLLSRRVDWRVVPGAMPASAPVRTPTPALSVRHAPDAAGVRYLRAATAAWRTAVDVAPTDRPWPAGTRQLAWLAPGATPAHVRDWARNGGTLLIDANTRVDDAPALATLWRDESGAPLIEAATYGRGRVVRFARALSPASMPQLLDASFPRHLRDALDGPASAPSRVRASDHAPADGGPAFALSPRDLQPWLALAIALLFLIERAMATGARRAVAP